MSVTTEAADQTPPCQPPKTNAVLPIVQLSESSPLLCVHYVEVEALAAAQATPDNMFYDIRGIVLDVVYSDDGPRLEACGDPSPEELRGKVIDALRETTELDTVAPDVAEELRCELPWLDAAPSLGALIGGLGSAPLTYAAAYMCQPGCSPHMRTHAHSGPPCCPGF